MLVLRKLFCDGYESMKDIRWWFAVGCSERSGFFERVDCLSGLVVNLVVVCCLKVKLMEGCLVMSHSGEQMVK